VSKKDKYTLNYESMYPGITQRPDVLAVLKESDRKIRYFEQDLKHDQKRKLENGEYIKLPSREDSIERLHENAVQFESEDSLYAQIEQKLLNEALRDSLQKLPARERDLIIGAYYDGKTQDELAKQFGITQQWVGELIQRGVSKLGSMLKNWKN